jgi:hypothetical protein
MGSSQGRLYLVLSHICSNFFSCHSCLQHAKLKILEFLFNYHPSANTFENQPESQSKLTLKGNDKSQKKVQEQFLTKI